MPNIITNKTLIDSTRTVRVHLNGQFDGASGQESQVIKINTWGLSGALSAASNNTQLLAGNGNPRSSYNLTISRIQFNLPQGGAAGPGHIANLAWQGSTNVPFFTMQGTGTWDAIRGVDLAIDPAVDGGAPGHTGNIVFSTMGFGPNDAYSITIDAKKDPKAFNQGQIERPKDFNIILATGNNV